MTVSAEVKPFWQSKVVWFNVILGAASLVPAVKEHLTPDVMAAVLAGVNVFLRFISKGKVTLS